MKRKPVDWDRIGKALCGLTFVSAAAALFDRDIGMALWVLFVLLDLAAAVCAVAASPDRDWLAKCAALGAGGVVMLALAFFLAAQQAGGLL